MYLLYLDEAGTHTDSDHVVVGGVAVFERSAYWLQQELDATVKRFFPETHDSVELHASPLRIREGVQAPPPYDQLTGSQRRQLLTDAFNALRESSHPVLFATVVKKAYVAPREPYEVAFEDLVSRFDLMLSRLHSQGNTQRGLLIVAESNYRERLEILGDQIRRDGTRWSQTRNLADVPLFTRTSRTRLLQAADLVTNATWGNYEKGLSRDFSQLLPRFDREGERLHGLTHISADAAQCMCPACYSWRVHNTLA